MTEVLADTSGWANYLVRSQPFHINADAYIHRWRAWRVRVVTTNYVLAELTAVLISPLRVPRLQQITTMATLRAAKWVKVFHIDPTLDNEAWDLWRARPDKDWSLVDCASFVVMQRRGIAEALTTDHHFEQAGFVRC